MRVTLPDRPEDARSWKPSRMRERLSTMCYLPGVETPERECWYINMGAVSKDFFTTDTMIRLAQ